MNCNTALIVIIYLMTANPLFAAFRNLGAAGDTYPVNEPDIMEQFRNGAAGRAKLLEELRRQIKDHRPRDLHHLSRAERNSTFMVDISIIQDENIVDTEGKIIYPKGYRFNPLKYITLPGAMVVIDGDDPEQVEWFRKSPYSGDRRVRLLLSGGQAPDLIDKLQRPVFYLTNNIASRLQLGSVPSLVIQKGKKIQVQEFYLPPESQESSDVDK